MKIAADRRVLNDALQLAASIVPSRAAIPTVTNLLLRAGSGGFEVAATDLDVALRLTVPEVEVAQEGAVAVSAARFAAVVRESASEKVHVGVDGTLAAVTMDDGKFRLVGMDPADFPAVPDFEERRAFEVEAKDLADMIRKTEFAASQDAGMYAMTGIFMELRERELRLVATDGKRLAFVRRAAAVKGGRGSAKGIVSAIVPPKAMKILQRMLTPADETIHIVLDESQVRFRTRRGVLASRLLEGRFPDYEEVIPKEFARRATVGTEAFAAALRRAALLAPEGARAVRLTFEPGGVELFSRSPDVGEAVVRIEGRYEAEKFVIVFNPDLLADYLKVVDAGEIELNMNSPTSAALLRGGKDYTYVVMPLQMSL